MNIVSKVINRLEFEKAKLSSIKLEKNLMQH